MTNAEAIKRLQKRICCEQPVAHFCNDSCMYGRSECEIALAIDALEKDIPKKVKFTFNNAYCPNCKNNYNGTLSHGCNFCDCCGQRLKWHEDDEDDG